MIFTCSACPAKSPDSFALSAPFPLGWFNRQLDEYGNLASGGQAFLLCPACGSDANFIGGISPHLRDLFLARGAKFKMK
jgi:hypothetical protein